MPEYKNKKKAKDESFLDYNSNSRTNWNNRNNISSNTRYGPEESAV
jgi:hypothetical protein